MPLTPGSRLGPYEIIDPIGAGGMGEVYRARDTRLDRTVAVKVLSSHIAAQDEIRQRFEREARAVSSLNHPHICTLHDIGHQDGTDYLVMEYLEGETLAARLTRGPLPLGQGLEFAIQIGDALALAHRQGIAHRDLKPGNIMLTRSGTKLLDFGLAKMAMGAAGDATRTRADNLTTAGTVLGTFQYMAPEQLEGREADARSDIFSFGAVLYEMVTGRRAFEGTTQASVAGAILHAEPPSASGLRPGVPPGLERVIRKCLAKDPEERWQTALDLTSELKWLAQGSSPISGANASVAAAPRSPLRRKMPIVSVAAAAVFAVLAAVLAFVHFRETPERRVRMHFLVSPPDKTGLRWYDVPVVSPDGDRVVFSVGEGGGSGGLWVRPIGSPVAQPLAGTGGGHLPFWSPDSRSIGFFGQGKLKRMDLAGGPPQTLADARSAGGSWNRDGVIVFSSPSGSGLHQIPARGGEPKPVTEVNRSREETAHLFPTFLPDGRRFLFTAVSSKSENTGVFAGSLDSQEARLVMAGDTNALFAAPGFLIFARVDTLLARPFDPKSLAFTGDPFPVAERVARMTLHIIPAALASVSQNGILAYRSGDTTPQTQLTWFDRTGRTLGTLGEPADYSNPDLSPDGTRVAVGILDPKTKTRDVWVFDLTRGTRSRLTFDPADDFNPTWSPDGLRIAFSSDRKGVRNLYMKAAAGTGEDQLVLASEETMSLDDWSPDGKFLAYNSGGSRRQTDQLGVLPLTGEGKPGPLVPHLIGENQAQFSPNGRWVAYQSRESGRPEIYVQSFPAGLGKWQVSTAGGVEPRWRGDGKELYYWEGVRLMAVEVNTDRPAFAAGIPKPLCEPARAEGNTRRNRFVVSRDGQRFLFITAVEDASTLPMHVVVNWAPPAVN